MCNNLNSLLILYMFILTNSNVNNITIYKVHILSILIVEKNKDISHNVNKMVLRRTKWLRLNMKLLKK